MQRGTGRRSAASGNAVCGHRGRRLQDGRRRQQLAALEARAVRASLDQPCQGMGDRPRGRPSQHERRLCRLRPRQQEHRRRPQLEDRVPAAPDALPRRERLRACDRPIPPRGDLRDHGRVRQSWRHARSRSTSRPTPARPGKRRQPFAAVSPSPHSPSIRDIRPPSTRPSVPTS